MPKRVLFLMSDTGGGHRASARAVAEGLHLLHGDEVACTFVDLFADFGSWPLNRIPQAYSPLVNHYRLLWRALWLIGDQPRLWRIVNGGGLAWQRRRIERCFAIHPADLVVSVHPLLNQAPQTVLRSVSPDSLFATVVTDLSSAPSTWYDPGVDFLSASCPEVAEAAVAAGVPADRVRVLGLPISLRFLKVAERLEAAFSQRSSPCPAPSYIPAPGEGTAQAQQANRPAGQQLRGPGLQGRGLRGRRLQTAARQNVGRGYRRTSARQHLGLDDLPTVLLVGGGEGMGRIEAIAVAIAGALTGKAGQLAIVCGRNQALKRRLSGQAWPIPTRVLGFEENMPDWMAAADCLVTKAGPGTIAEALASGLPMLIYDFVPGQESGNIGFIGRHGVGYFETEPKAIAGIVQQWLAPGNQVLPAMRERALQVARPRAAIDIAEALSNLW